MNVGTSLHALVERIADWRTLDTPAQAVADGVRTLTDPDPVKNLLSGGWLGHRLHPVLTDMVIGSLTSSAILDLFGGEETQGNADRLLGIGLVSALPTAASGLADWTDVYGRGRRVGLVHAAVNVLTIGLGVASLVARRRGQRLRGVALSTAGLGTLYAGSYLGGHLSLVYGVGVDHTAFEEGPKDWTPVLAEAELVEDVPRAVRVGDTEVMVVRVDGDLVALSNRCSHAGWPLADGPVAAGCITCPYHGSVYRLRDGSVVRGPAASPQLRFDVRVSGGRVEVRGR